MRQAQIDVKTVKHYITAVFRRSFGGGLTFWRIMFILFYYVLYINLVSQLNI